eukprot:GHVN01097522.1.p1 GENE.GHVN01097522.1~~GHVN01097522.1.p1  ORF type:complete len:699 (+),score=-59.27 GHVN01097522.1:107-2203(+)
MSFLNYTKNFVENCLITPLDYKNIIYNSIYLNTFNEYNIKLNKYNYFFKNNYIYLYFTNLNNNSISKFIFKISKLFNYLNFNFKLINNNIVKFNYIEYFNCFNSLNFKFKKILNSIIKNLIFFLFNNNKKFSIGFDNKFKFRNIVNSNYSENITKLSEVIEQGNPVEINDYHIFSEKLFGTKISYKCSCSLGINLNNIINKVIYQKNLNYRCNFCRLEYISNEARVYRSALIDLNTICCNPYFINLLPKPIYDLLYEKFFIKFLELEESVELEQLNKYKKKSIHCVEDIDYDLLNSIFLIVNNILLPSNLNYNIRKIILDLNLISNLSADNIEINEGIDCNLKILKNLLNLKLNKFTADIFFIKYIPVTPPGLREDLLDTETEISPIDKNTFDNKYLVDEVKEDYNVNDAYSNINDYYNTSISMSNEILYFNNSPNKKTKINSNLNSNLIGIITYKVQCLLFNNLTDFSDNHLKFNEYIFSNLKFKEGIFRLNILGKRIDFSSRTTITVNSNLKNYSVALPYRIGLNLFKEHLKLLIDKNISINNKSRVYTLNSFILKYSLFLIYNSNLILLNRSPTLHRFNIQGFKPKLTNSYSISIHPFACEGFNADFDGDQMGVYLPLSIKSQLEAKFSINFKYNIMQFKHSNYLKSLKQNSLYGLNFYLNLNLNYFRSIFNYIVFKDIYDIYLYNNCINTDSFI